MHEAIYELRTSSTQRIITAVGGLFVLTIIVVGGRAGDITIQIVPIAFSGMLFSIVAYRLLPQRLRVAQGMWVAGCAITLSMAIAEFKIPELTMIIVVVPLFTILTLGWVATVVSSAFVVGWILWFPSLVGMNVPQHYLIMVLWVGALLILAGWAAISPLMSGVKELSEINQSETAELVATRNQKLEMEQYRHDLLRVNTELNRMTDRLKTMTQLAEESRRVKEEFVANVSHELRTPLNMIIGYTELMVKSPQTYGRKLPSKLLADLATIQRNSQHLVELINDVLDLSQVDAGRMTLARKWVSLHEIVNAAVVATQPLFHSKGLYMRVAQDDDDLQVYCDATRIHEVILNLLSNAVRFTDQGGVVLKAAHNNDELVISIQDTGPGISPEDQKKLFEPFQQLDDLLHHGRGGSGLGLSISKRFVELHNGRMWLESTVGKGATFSFSIPLPSPAGAGTVNPYTRWINPYQDYETRDHINKLKLAEPAPRFVIVEQEDSLRRLFAHYLQDVEVVAVPNIAEGICELERSPAQAIIVNTPLDKKTLGMADVTISVPFNTPVISCWVPGRKEAARRMGVVQYLLKPISPAALLKAIDDVDGQCDNPKQVLLVDDDAETLRLFARILSSLRPRYTLILTTSGREALDLMKTRKPDVVLLDLILADLDGSAVLKAKGEDDTICNIPVIVVSSTDPAGMPMLPDVLLVGRHNGLSTQELLACLQAVSQVLSSAPRRPGQAQPENPAG